MTSPELSPEERERADALFKAAQTQAIFGFVLLTLLFCWALMVLLRSILHLDFNFGGVIGIGVVGSSFAGRFYGTHRVRKAGLSLDRVERHFIPKTAAQFDGEPVEVRVASTRSDGLAGIVILSLVAALLIWLQMSGHGLNPIIAALGVVVLLLFGMQAALRLSNPPVLRLDSAGAFNGAQHFWPQRASWSNIVGVELMRFFDYKGNEASRRLVFRDAKNKAVIVVLLLSSQFSASQVEELLAQVEAIFRGESKISSA